MILATVLAAMSVGAQPDPLVTADLPVGRLDKVLDAINKLSGTKLAGIGQANGHFIFVKVKDLPLSRLKAHLAAAVDGRWTKRGDMDVLSSALDSGDQGDSALRSVVQAWFKKHSPPEPMSQAEADEIIRSAAALQAKDMNEFSPGDFEKQRQINEKTPFQRALTAMVLALGQGPFLALEDNDRVVYSSRATRLQRPLPPAAGQVLQQMNREALMYIERLRIVGPARPGQYYTEAIHGYLHGAEIASETTLVILRRASGRITARLQRFSREGGHLGSVDVELGSTFSAPPESEAAPGTPRAFASLTEGIKLSPKDEAASGELLSTILNGPQPQPPFSAETLAVLAGLEGRDLLDLLPGTALRQASSLLGRNIVAYIPDVLIFAPLFSTAGSGKPMPVGEMLSFLSEGSMYRVEPAHVDDGQTIVFPASKERFLRQGLLMRFRRPALRSAVARASREGFSLDAAADVSLVAEEPEFALALAPVVARAGGERAPLEQRQLMNSALRIYGALNDPMRLRAKQGVLRIPLASAEGAIKDEISRAIFSIGVPLTRPPKQPSGRPGPAKEPDDATDYQWQMERSPTSLQEEPTVALANGWPAGAAIEITVPTTPSYFGFVEEGGKIKQFANLSKVSIPSMAATLALSEVNPSPDWVVYNRFKAGETTRVMVRIDFGDAGQMETRYIHDRLPKNAKILTMDQMPASFQEEFKAALAKARKTYRGVQVDRDRSGGGARPPLVR